MTKLIAQHGAAKGKKLETAITNEYLSGVVFSPREESFSSINNYFDTSAFLSEGNTFLDPQLYYSTFEGNIFKHLEDDICYPTKVTRRDWRKKTPELMDYLDAHVENSTSISDSLITPGFFIQNLDWHFDYSIDIYEYCCENYGFKKYYLSLLISNNFFHSKSDVDEMLEDILDNVDHRDGIYFTVCYDSSDEKNYEFIDSQNLANILYFVYSLKRAGFDIIIGYSFLNAILFAMLDCEYVASGWFNNTRKFISERFEEISKMGRRKKRYTSLPLFTYITFENLNLITENTDIDYLLSGCDIDEYMYVDQDSISFVDLEQQYWQALSVFFEKVNSYNSISEKITFVLSEIIHAKELYNSILSSFTADKIIYDKIKTNMKHLDSWIMGIEIFKKRILLI